jgi:hypothetical protein
VAIHRTNVVLPVPSGPKLRGSLLKSAKSSSLSSKIVLPNRLTTPTASILQIMAGSPALALKLSPIGYSA